VTCWVQHFLIHRLLPLYLIYYDGVDGIMLLLGKLLCCCCNFRIVLLSPPHTPLSAAVVYDDGRRVYAIIMPFRVLLKLFLLSPSLTICMFVYTLKRYLYIQVLEAVIHRNHSPDNTLQYFNKQVIEWDGSSDRSGWPY
jgi:hypothetical protein